MPNAYKRVMALLPELTEAEQHKLKGAITALIGVSPDAAKRSAKKDQKNTADDTFADSLLDSIATVLRNLGVERPSVRRMKQWKEYSSFKDKAEGLRPWLSKGPSEAVARAAFMQIAVRLLYDDLRNNGVPVRYDQEHDFLVRAPLVVGSREIMIFIDRMPAVVDRSFPGYLQAGLLSKVVRRETNVRPK